VDKETQGEAYVSTQQPAACPSAWVPPSDVDQGGSRGHPASACQRPPPPVGLIWRVRDRSTLRALQRQGHRGRSGSVTVMFLPGDTPPQLAFAVTRKVGGSVARNRVRRRLRAAFLELSRESGVAGGGFLISTRSDADEHTFEKIKKELSEALSNVGAMR